MQHRVLCPPAQWMDAISPIDSEEECAPLLPYLKGDVLEMFCRSGRLGEFLTSEGIAWSGMDPDAHLLEYAFLRGMFSVSCGIQPPTNSYDTIFGAFGTLSCISPHELDSFVCSVFAGLRTRGCALFELWYESQNEEIAPFMDTYDGVEKLVRACVPQIKEDKVCFTMEWMIAQPNRTPFYQEYREERFLHSSTELCSLFGTYFSDVSIAELGQRRWIIACKS